MSKVFDYRRDHASSEEIVTHFLGCDGSFLAALRIRTSLPDYAHKLHSRALRFEAWSGDRLAGLLAAYRNDSTATAYISNVSVLSEHCRQGIASHLFTLCLAQSRQLGLREAALEVAHDNHAAIDLYRRHGFSSAGAPEENILRMHLPLIRSPRNQRDT